MKKTLTDIDGALSAQRATDARPRPDKYADTTFGLFQRQDGQLGMGNKVIQLGANGKNSLVDGAKYKLTPDLLELITNKHPRAGQWKTNDYQVYKSLVAQTKEKSFPNRAGTARSHATWKWKHMIRKMVIPGDRITEEEESEDTDGTDSMASYPDIASVGDIDRTAPGILSSDSGISSQSLLWKS